MGSLPEYDPRVIEQFAENLYRKASAFVAGSVAVGAALGAGLGAVPLTSLGDAWPVPSIFGLATMLIGGVFGSAIGYVIGDTRSFGYRLQAQTALCQLQTERNTAMLAKAIRTVQTRQPAPRAAQQQSVAQPPAQPQPAPQAPAPPAAPVSPPVQQQPAPPAQPAEGDAAPVAPPLSPPVSAARVA